MPRKAVTQPSLFLLSSFSVGFAILAFFIGFSLHDLPSHVYGKVLGTKTTAAVHREDIIFLGSGSSYDREWITLPQAAVMLEPAYYPKIVKVTFEAALSIVGGEVYARLINQTTGEVVWSSSVTHNTPTPSWKTSSPVTLKSGKNTYAVQIQSSSGELAQVHGARIRIIHE